VKARVAAAFLRSVALCVLPAAAVASRDAHVAKVKVKKPATGSWKVTTGGGDDDLLGSFTVTSGQVSALQGTIQSGAPTDCGPGPVSIPAQQRITRINIKSGGYPYDFYEVGGVARGALVPDPPISVSVDAAGSAVQGTLFIQFAPKGASGTGEIRWDDGQCELDFNVAHG